MNAGPIIHPPLIMMNAGPLEHFEAWDIHNEGTVSSIRRVTDALDQGVQNSERRLDMERHIFPSRITMMILEDGCTVTHLMRN